jgi:ArsR family transcriptional regulator
VRRRRVGLDVRGAAGAAELSPVRRHSRPPSLSREALELVAQRFRALSDPTRLALLQALFREERTVQELARAAGTSQANTSKHLALLLDQGLVARRRDGLFARYRIADRSLERLCHVVCGSLAERHAAVRARLAS